MAPNGYALQSVVLLDHHMKEGDYLVTALVYPDAPDQSWAAVFAEKAGDVHDFSTYIGLPVPEANGLMDAPDLTTHFSYTIEYPELTDSGIGGEIGQTYIENENGSAIWGLWVWSFGDEEESLEPVEFQSFVGHYSSEVDKIFVFTDYISVKLSTSGASQLGLAVAAAMTATIGLF